MNDPRFTHEDGTLKTRAEREAYAAAQQRAKNDADFERRQAEARNKKPSSGLENRIAELRGQLRYAPPAEIRRIKTMLSMLEPRQLAWEQEQAAQAKGNAFAKHALCELARESAERIARSGSVIYPSASETDLLALVALDRERDTFPDPDSYAATFFERLEKLESAEAERAMSAAADKQAAAHKADAEAARAGITAIESQQRLADIRGQA